MDNENENVRAHKGKPKNPHAEIDGVKKSIETYVGILLEYNKKVNLISRQITMGAIEQLLDETILLESYISNDFIVDAGSGNGILGIPLAIMNKDKQLVLVEPKKKKVAFLDEVKERMSLSNVDVVGSSIDEFIRTVKNKGVSLVARGFPDIGVFIGYVKKGIIDEAVLVTSENKIKKNQLHLESVRQKTYNISLRKHLKILQMEKTARGNQKKK